MRGITLDCTTVLESSNVPLLVLVELQFNPTPSYLTNAGFTITYNGHDWIGLGGLGSISGIKESDTLEMHGCQLTLSGIPPEIIATALNPGKYQGRNAIIRLAPLNNDHQILADPIITFQGIMDTMSVQLGSSATIQMTVESRLLDWERPRIRRYNNEDQTAAHPNDTGMKNVPQMVEKEIVWGRA